MPLFFTPEKSLVLSAERKKHKFDLNQERGTFWGQKARFAITAGKGEISERAARGFFEHVTTHRRQHERNKPIHPAQIGRRQPKHPTCSKWLLAAVFIYSLFWRIRAYSGSLFAPSPI